MNKLVNFCNLMKKTGQYTEYVKKVDFWPDLPEIFGCHGDVKNDGHTIDKSNFLWRMNEQLLKFQSVRVNRLFKTLIKPYGVASTSLVRPRVNKRL